MLNTKTILAGLIIMLAYHATALTQTRIDSLRTILEQVNIPDSITIKTSVEVCNAIVNTDKEYLLPDLALKGLEVNASDNEFMAHSISILHELLGNYYCRLGKMTNAIEHFERMRLIGEADQDSTIIAKSNNGLGTVYYQMGSFPKALDYYYKALSLSGTDTLFKVRIYNNIGSAFTSLGPMDSVMQYYNKSVAYHLSHQNFNYLSTTYSEIAILYQKQKNDAELKKYFNLALDASLKANEPFQTAGVYLSIGEVILDQHPDIAADYFGKALALAQQTNNYDQIIKSLEKLAFLSEKKRDFERAYEYLNLLVNLDNSLDSKQSRNRLEQLEYEQNADTKRNIATAKSNRQKSFLVILSVSLAALFILLLMSYNLHRLRMKISRTRDKFFSMIAHDIKSPFSGILGLSELIKEESESHPDPLHQKQVASLHESLTHVYDLLDNLLVWSQSETGKIAFKPQIQIVAPIVEGVIQLHQASAKQKGITIVNEVAFGLTARFDANMFHTILRNLASNAIKFSPDKATVFISAIKQGNEVLVAVRDQGVGMDASQIEKVFKSDDRISTPGTRNEKGTGLGLILGKNFITRHGGKIKVESKKGEGTTISFTLPD